MLDIKKIRKDPDFFSKKLSDRNSKINLDNLINVDKLNRELIQKKEKLEQEKKLISQKRDKSLFQKSKEISSKIEKLNKEQSVLKNKIESELSSLPNIALDDVPIGKDENSNKEIKKVGNVINFNFKPLSHDELGKKLNFYLHFLLVI